MTNRTDVRLGKVTNRTDVRLGSDKSWRQFTGNVVKQGCGGV